MTFRALARAFALGLPLLAGCHAAPPDWHQDLQQRLPRLGHRNLIAVVDSAYPAQTAPGVTTLYVGGGQLDVLAAVLQAVRAAGHVQPKIVLDAELTAVTDTMAPGIGAYRHDLEQQLAGLPVQRLPHADVISMLDTTARQFEVLVLKTDLRLPYTSVFVSLDCGYWDGAREATLRKALEK